jgi:DNA recombination protein RmuC
VVGTLDWVILAIAAALIAWLATAWRASERRRGEQTQTSGHWYAQTQRMDEELRRYRERFASATGRGELGQTNLEQAVQVRGLREGVHYQRQPTAPNGQRPDLVLLLGARPLPVDAKCLVEPYWEARDAPDAAGERAALSKLARSVRANAEEIVRRGYGWAYADTAGIVLYVPGDDIAVAALDADPSLLSWLLARGVYLVGPTGFALLATICRLSDSDRELRDGLAQVKTDAGQAHRALDAAVRDFNTLGGHLRHAAQKWQDVRDDLGASVAGVNEFTAAVGSLGELDEPKAVVIPLPPAAPSVELEIVAPEAGVL